MIILHHLNFSRSSRVIWLLEELGLDYEIVRHERTEQFRAPDTLKAVHPLGKAPVIQDGSLTLAESATILDYINVRYGEGRLAPPAGSDAGWTHNEWLHYAESSAGLPIMTALLGAMTGGLPPGLDAFNMGELTKTLAYIDATVGEGPYLLGEPFTIADIQMSYLLTAVRMTGKLADFRGLQAYLARLEERPAFAKTLEIGGPLIPGR